MKETSSYNRIGAVPIIDAVMKYLVQQREPASGKDIATAIGQKHSITMSYLESLSDIGWLQRVTGRYQVAVGFGLLYYKFLTIKKSVHDALGKEITEIGG